MRKTGKKERLETVVAPQILRVSATEVANNFGKYKKIARDGNMVIVEAKGEPEMWMVPPEIDYVQRVLKRPLSPMMQKIRERAKGAKLPEDFDSKKEREEYFHEQYAMVSK